VTVRDNEAWLGGGVAAEGSFHMEESTIRDNLSLGAGGGLYGHGSVTLERSTISGNQAGGRGGGTYHDGFVSLLMIESTVSSNSTASSGGAIFVTEDGTVNVYNSTIVFNRADANDDGTGDGGGIVNDVGGSVTVNVRNCLIAGNYIVNFFDWDDCVGTIESYGRNLFGDVAGCSVVTGSGTWGLLNDLGTIGPLTKNGGPTWTHALYPGSNAIDGGDPADGCGTFAGPLTIDQRGVPRVNGVRCDIGAYEYGVLFADGFELGDVSAWPN
jgi:predicted outer membrane repeat protein